MERRVLLEAQDIGLDDKPLESFIPPHRELSHVWGEEGEGRDRPVERHRQPFGMVRIDGVV